MRNTFIDTILDISKTRKDIFIISGDAGLGVFDDFKEKFPGQFLNLGIAEQNAASFSAGMALAGYKVYIYNIIPFLLYRCYEQIRNDICYQRLPVVLVGIGSGVTYALQGITHYSVEDIGLVQTLPNLTAFSPIDPIEAKLAAIYSLGCKKPMYIRLPKRGEPKIHKSEDFDVTKPQLIESGEDVAIVFHGSIGVEALKAKEILKGKKIYPRLISIPMVKPFDIGALLPFLNGIGNLVSVEEHYIGCGLGSIIAKEYALKRPDWRFFSLGIPDRFIHEVKDVDGMRGHFGISGKRIAEFVAGIYKKGR